MRTRVILAIGFVALIAYAFPGYMSTDSVAQLVEARSGLRSDAHPPLMAFEWEILDAVVSGPLLMLCLQGVLALAGFFMIFRQQLSPRRAALAAIGVLLFPPVLTTFGVIWKDSQMAAYLLVGTALLVAPSLRMRLLGLLAMVAACGMRHNAPAAAMPIIGLLFEWRTGLRWWKRYAISTAAAIGVVVCALGVTHVLAVKRVPLSPATVDIVGVLAGTYDRSDADLLRVLAGTPLHVSKDIQARAKQLYNPRNPFAITHGDDRMFDEPANDEQVEALSRAWKEIVRSDWRAYLTFRIAAFRELLGLTDTGLWAPVWNDFLESRNQGRDLQHEAARSPVQAQLAYWFSALADDTPLFRPYFYALLALILLVFARDRLTLALLASGLLYELAYFPVVSTPDVRYSHWLITTTCVALVLIIVKRARRTS